VNERQFEEIWNQYIINIYDRSAAESEHISSLQMCLLD
jgi:hypothetical protein